VLAAFGARPAAPLDSQPQAFEVWPENWSAVCVMSRAMTQWNVGMAGATGLRYEALPMLARLHGVKRADWPEFMADIQAMEAEILRSWREQADAAR
jgi:hypothetical protein